MKNHKIMKFYFTKYKIPYAAGLFILIFIVNYLQLFIPQIIGIVTDGVQSGTLTQAGIVNTVIQLLMIVLIVALGRIGWRFFIIGSARKIERDIRESLFEKWLTLDAVYFNQHKTGNLMAYATNDLNAVKMMMGQGVVIITDAIVLTVLVVWQMASYVDIKLTLLAILPMPFITLSSLYFGKHTRQRFGMKQAAFAKLSDKVQESFSGISVIKTFVQEENDINDFNQISKENYNKNIHLAKISAIMSPLMPFLVSVSLLITISYGGYLTMINEITIGQFVTFNQYILMLSWPMSAVAAGINIFAQGLASARRLEEVLNTEATVKDTPTTKPLEISTGEISIKNLSFNFPDNLQPGVKDINLEIKAGETVAILGRTGSGKSTLINLLLRVYNAPEASIYINGQDIMKHTLKSVRETFAYVPQDNFLFSETVRNNIAFGLDEDEKTDEIIENVAKCANVHHNIVDFKNQYETVVGERGTMLSGGQKQRISIARALILDAPILILDDSLSAVDTKTEEAILKNLRQERLGKTTIIIAHRVSTVKHADKIIVLEKGQIIESGTHDILLEQNGVYAKMNEQQQLESEVGGESIETI